MTQEIIFLKGLPASGKSTWATKYLRKNPIFRRINKDDIREELGNPPWSKAFENQVLAIQRERGIGYLENGFSLIVDDTNFAKKHEDFWQEKAAKHGYEFTVKFFDVPVEDCILRDQSRKKSVGEAVIRRMYKQHLKGTYKINDDRFILEQDDMLPPCIICDLDGTLSLITDRSPYDFAKCKQDRANPGVIDIMWNYYNMDVEVIFVTGRKEYARKETLEWLTLNTPVYDNEVKLYMRANDDDRSDAIFKKEIYEDHIFGQYNVLFVLEDRDSVVKMYRDLGLLCLQVYYGNF